MAIWKGYNPPFLTDSSVLPIQQDARLIKNDLIQLLLTVPGERIMKPEIGTPIRSLVFEHVVDSDIASLKSEIRTSIERFEPRVTVVEILIQIDNDNSTITITIYGVVNLESNDKFKIDIGMTNGDVTFVRAR
jgi:phage baseplate assembly protein W